MRAHEGGLFGMKAGEKPQRTRRAQRKEAENTSGGAGTVSLGAGWPAGTGGRYACVRLGARPYRWLRALLRLAAVRLCRWRNPHAGQGWARLGPRFGLPSRQRISAGVIPQNPAARQHRLSRVKIQLLTLYTRFFLKLHYLGQTAFQTAYLLNYCRRLTERLRGFLL